MDTYKLACEIYDRIHEKGHIHGAADFYVAMIQETLNANDVDKVTYSPSYDTMRIDQRPLFARVALDRARKYLNGVPPRDAMLYWTLDAVIEALLSIGDAVREVAARIDNHG